MAQEKDCCNKTRDAMELEVQMTSMTLDFSSDSFLLCNLLEKWFEIICHEALHEGMCLEIRVGSFPVWVGAAWCCSLSFSMCACLALVKVSFFPWYFSLEQGWVVLVDVCVCLCLPESPWNPSCALQSCFEGRGKRNREKEMIDSSPLDFCC